MNYFLKSASALALGCCIVATLGCGPTVPPGTIVKGRVVENGKVIPAPRADVAFGLIQLELYPAAGSTAKSGDATTANAEGEFQFLGAGGGVEPGEYELALVKVEQEDHFKGKFARGKTPIRVTVTADQKELDLGDIDVAKY